MTDYTTDEFMDLMDEMVPVLDDDQLERLSFIIDAALFDRGMNFDVVEDENE